MNDQAKYTVTLEFQTTGADKEINNLRELQRGVDDLARNGGITQKSSDRLSRSINGLSGAMGDASGSTRQHEDSIISLRYANYDLATSLLGTAAAISAVGIASVAAFASQESAFTEVERIADGSRAEIEELRDELQKMSTEIPVAFGELSNIASLGAALDIPANQLDEFTNAVAKFSATTGVTVDAAASGFGKLAAYLKIPEEEFENLGSAILRAGNISVATEEQVLKFAQALALPGARIGFTTDQVVALGATLASFGNINVEGAGSALSRVAKLIERDLADSGEGLERWAATAGMSAEAFRVAWGSDASGTFNRIIQGLSTNVEGLTRNLDALGLRNIRDQRIIEALALNYDKYNQILGETTSAWREGTYMSEAYGLVLDDLMSKWTIFVNALTNAAAAVGAQVAPAIGGLLDVTTKLLVMLSEFAEHPLGEHLLRMVGTAAALAAGWLALRGVIALATGSMQAFLFITRATGGLGILSGLKALAGTILGVRNASGAAATATFSLAAALRAVMRATIIGGALLVLSEILFNTGEAAYAAGNAMDWMANATTNAFFGIADAIAQVSPYLATVFAVMGVGFSPNVNPVAGAIQGAGRGLRDWGAEAIKARAETERLQGALLDASGALEDFSDLGPDAMGGLGNSAADAAKEVRTLVDYANDLRQVWDRAFEIRFSGQSTLDTITSSFISIREAADEAAKRIRDLNNDIRSLSSDIDIQEYFLSIAVEYGDTKRAAAIEAELAKMRAQLADKTEDLQKEQDKTSKSLVGNSKSAIENRKTIQDLVQQYQAHIGALAASGMSQEQLAEATARLRADFIQQATQLGFNRAELELYARAFDDVAVAISRVPRNITVDANVDPAVQALNELNSRLSGTLAQANNLRGALERPMTMSVNTGQVDAALARRARGEQILGMIMNANAGLLEASRAGNRNLALGFIATINHLTSILSSGNYASGGFTGRGGMYEPAGIVHKGEYVIPKSMVNQSTGLPYADALGRLMQGLPSRSSSPAASSSGSSGVTTVALTAGTIQAIANATGKVLVLDGKIIADSSANVYSNETTVGAY